jgi:hypothetical protein
MSANYLTGLTYVIFNASSMSQPIFSFLDLMQLDILLVGGFCFDSVSKIWDPSDLSRAWHGSVNDMAGSRSIHPLFALLPEQVGFLGAYGDHELLLQAVGATWVAGLI